jgi:serine/threonine-protein kinase
MEYVEGSTIAQLLRRETCLPPRRAISIGWHIADALTAAHDLGMVHRDLKPENVIVGTLRNGGDLVKVVDFGLARIMDAESQVVTRTGDVIGTPYYMSPEQMTGDAVDARSDIYSMALVVFAMLTGMSPWHSDTVAEVPGARLFNKPRRLAELRPDVAWPAALQAAFDRALALSPQNRYASASDFASDIVDAVLAWMPDDPRAVEPWNARLRYETPRGTPRTPSTAVPAIGQTTDHSVSASGGSVRRLARLGAIGALFLVAAVSLPLAMLRGKAPTGGSRAVERSVCRSARPAGLATRECDSP